MDRSGVEQVIADSLRLLIKQHGGLETVAASLVVKQPDTGVIYQPFAVDKDPTFSEIKAYLKRLTSGDIFTCLDGKSDRFSTYRNLAVTMKKLGVAADHNIAFAVQELEPDFDYFVMSAPFSQAWYFMYVDDVTKAEDHSSEKAIAELQYFQYDPQSSGFFSHFDFKRILMILPISNQQIQKLYLYQFPKYRGNLHAPECGFEYEDHSYRLGLDIHNSDMLLEFSILSDLAPRDKLKSTRDYIADILRTADREYIMARADQMLSSESRQHQKTV